MYSTRYKQMSRMNVMRKFACSNEYKNNFTFPILDTSKIPILMKKLFFFDENNSIQLPANFCPLAANVLLLIAKRKTK